MLAVVVQSAAPDWVVARLAAATERDVTVSGRRVAAHPPATCSMAQRDRSAAQMAGGFIAANRWQFDGSLGGKTEKVQPQTGAVAHGPRKAPGSRVLLFAWERPLHLVAGGEHV